MIDDNIELNINIFLEKPLFFRLVWFYGFYTSFFRKDVLCQKQPHIRFPSGYKTGDVRTQLTYRIDTATQPSNLDRSMNSMLQRNEGEVISIPTRPKARRNAHVNQGAVLFCFFVLLKQLFFLGALYRVKFHHFM